MVVETDLNTNNNEQPRTTTNNHEQTLDGRAHGGTVEIDSFFSWVFV